MREWLTKARQKETYEQFRKAVIYGISEEVTQFFEDDAPGKFCFEKRDGQLDMAYDILDALRQKQHIAVEAGVGIGKSFAYLVPMLLYRWLNLLKSNATIRGWLIVCNTDMKVQKESFSQLLLLL